MDEFYLLLYTLLSRLPGPHHSLGSPPSGTIYSILACWFQLFSPDLWESSALGNAVYGPLLFSMYT